MGLAKAIGRMYRLNVVLMTGDEILVREVLVSIVTIVLYPKFLSGVGRAHKVALNRGRAMPIDWSSRGQRGSW